MSSLKELVKEIRVIIKNDPIDQEEVSERIDDICRVFEDLEAEKQNQPKDWYLDIRKQGTVAWNIAIECTQRLATTTQWLAKLRFIACKLIRLGWREESYKKHLELLRLYAKTGKEWSELSNFEKAFDCFRISIQYADKVMHNVEFSTNSEVQQHKQYQYVYQLHFWRAEAIWKCDKQNESFQVFCREIKPLLSHLPEETKRLAMVEYNYGLELYEKQDYKNAINWLKESHEIYESDPQRDESKQARTLRLMSYAYMELSSLESAMNCINIANKIYKTDAGKFLQFKLFLMAGHNESAEKYLHDLISDGEANSQIKITACMMPAEYERDTMSINGFEKLLEYLKDEESISEARMRYFECVLNNDKNIEKSKEMIDKVLRDHSTSEISLSSEIKKNYHACLWNKAVYDFKENKFKQSIIWFQYVLQLIEADDTFFKAKILRFLGRCHMEINALDDALTAAQDAEHFDPKSLQTHFLLFKIYCRQENTVKACVELQKMMESEEFKSDYLALAGQEAFERGRYPIAATALEKMLESQEPCEPKMQGLVLRNLIKLASEMIEDHSIDGNIHRLIRYAQMTLEKLKNFEKSQLFEKDEEIEFMQAMCWNQGLETVKKEDYEYSWLLFKCAYEFGNYLENNVSTLETKKMSLLLRLYSLTELVDQDPSSDVNSTRMKTALEEINEAFKIGSTLNDMKKSKDSNLDKTIPLLCIAELKFRINLDQSEDKLKSLIDYCSSLASTTPRTFEIMGSVILDSGKYTHLGRTAIEYALDSLQRSSDMDYSRFLGLCQLLIESCSTRESSFGYFKQAIDLLKSDDIYFDDDSLEMVRIKWMTTEAWNNGVYFLRLNRNEKAEKWMSMAVSASRLLKEDDTTRQEIIQSYSTALSKMETTN
eukprot:gb/GECH01005351.1/.p1 GENE.gb/GECH01005351.1/~~gb/GECH01005351.1/.p1  ORF type:complete len:887 (+),score=232.12 gb/GECH01005351.1/:1-2661(+)